MMFPVDDHALRDLDARELHYKRVAISEADVEIVDIARSPVGRTREEEPAQYWTYVVKDCDSSDCALSSDCPILQTYVDVVVEGFLRTRGRCGAISALRNVKGWSTSPWVNDREHPRYIRALPDVDIAEVDSVLSEALPGGVGGRTVLA